MSFSLLPTNLRRRLTLGQILEDYEKQLQHLKKQVEEAKKDFEDWERQHNPAPAPAAAGQ